MQGRKVTAPIARSTAYDFNAHLAPSHLKNCSEVSTDAIPCANHPEVRDVMPHEILFTFRKPNVRDSRMRGMTSLNGVALPSDVYKGVNAVLQSNNAALPTFDSQTRLEDRTAIAKYLEQNRQVRNQANDALTSFFEYVGVAITPCSAGNASALQRQGFSATRGGLMTVMNTGMDTIYAGQKVKMVLDVVDVLRQARGINEMIGGIPRQKIVARLQPVHNSTPVQNVGSATKKQTTTVPVNMGTPLLPEDRNAYAVSLAKNRVPIVDEHSFNKDIIDQWNTQ